MRPLRLVVLKMLFVVVCIALPVAALVAEAPASSTEPAAGATFTL